MIDEFFNKKRYTVSKLTDQLDVRPDIAFSLPTYIVDALTFKKPSTVSAKLMKINGRDIVELPTVVSVVDQTFSATPALVDWDGKTSLSLKVLIDGTHSVIVPLVQKG